MGFSDKSDSYFLQLILKKIEDLQSLFKKRKKPFLTIQEASDYLDISKNTLYGYTSKGILPFYKIRNRKIYFRISDLNRFVLNPDHRIADYPELEKNEPIKIESSDPDNILLSLTGKKGNIKKAGDKNEKRKIK